jgi:hypothetical protein
MVANFTFARRSPSFSEFKEAKVLRKNDIRSFLGAFGWVLQMKRDKEASVTKNGTSLFPSNILIY